MTSLVDVLLAALAVFVAVPLGVFALEVFASLLPMRRRATNTLLGRRPRVVVLIPAHDEEAGIGGTLRSVWPALAADDRILVVADNCGDGTAEVARRLGAEVVERLDAERRGKGYALDFGVAHLAAGATPEVLVVVDADCTITSETIARLAETVVATGRPAQSLNLADDDPDPTPLQAVSALSLRFKNLVRSRGAERLGWPCHLMGTGMALPWDVAERVSFGGGNLVEDMQLGTDLAIEGRPGVFEPRALVTSPLPRREAAFVSQRTRWEHGHVRTAVRNVPRLLWKAVCTGRWGTLGLALDLCVPPLSLLMFAWLAATLVSFAGWCGGAAVWALCVLLAAGGVFGAAVVVGWFAHCRRVVPWTTFVRVPWFVLRKVPIYLGLLSRRPGEWVRTAREAEVVVGRGTRVEGEARGRDLDEQFTRPGAAAVPESDAGSRSSDENGEETR